MAFPKSGPRIVLIGAGAVILALFAARQAFVSAFAGRSPELVAWAAPDDPSVLVGRYDRSLTDATAPDGREPDWAGSARRALRDAPLSSGVMRVLALTASGEARQRTLMALSERISKRDLLTQLWLIEDSVQRNDLTGALEHYDRSLSVFPSAREKLFAILAGALDEPEVRVALAPYVRANRPWAYDFVGFATSNAASPVYVADLFRLSGGSAAVPGQRPLETQLLMKLVSTGHVALAHQYARRMAGGGRAALDRFELDKATLDPSLRPFTWSITDDALVDVSFDPGEGLDIIAGPGVHGQAANRVMMLHPGRWSFTQTVELPSLSPMAAGTWTATCIGMAEPERIWLQDIPLQSGRQTYRSNFVVPTNCPAVRFELNVRGDDSQVEARLSVADMELTAG